MNSKIIKAGYPALTCACTSHFFFKLILWRYAPLFDYFISLGSSCPIASSMAKYGLRSFSGPFDWLITEDFNWVLHTIETNFFDFLQQNNLEPYLDQEKFFKDKMSGFIFLHENENYKSEFDALKQKYAKRIKRFCSAAQKRTCFLRSIPSKKDLDYIMNHAEYIRKVITKNNSENQIIFLAAKEVEIPEDMPFKTYKMLAPYGGMGHAKLRAFFDGASEFLNFCGENYFGSSLLKNLEFDGIAENEFVQSLELEGMRYSILTKCLFHDFTKSSLPSKTIIYGAGNLGKTLYLKIQNLTQVEYFIDRSKFGTEFQGIPIWALDDLANVEGATVIVSTTYDFDEIKAKIQEKFGKIPVVSLDDFLNMK